MKLIKKFRSSGLIWLWITIVLLTLDRCTKTWMLNHLTLSQPVPILPIFNLTLAYNTGAAFGFLHTASGWQNWFLGGLALLVSGAIVIWLTRLPARAWWTNVALCLILGGAFGNIWDRLLYGYVIDFLSFHWHDWYFAIFNIADSGVCVGAFMLILTWWGSPKKL